MSASRISLGIQYAMLDGRKECVPGFEDSSGGHIIFKTMAKTHGRGVPGSHIFDGFGMKNWDDKEFSSVPFNRDAWVVHTVNELKKELALDAARGDTLLKSLVGNLYDQAKAHCDEHHQDIRAKWKAKL